MGRRFFLPQRAQRATEKSFLEIIILDNIGKHFEF